MHERTATPESVESTEEEAEDGFATLYAEIKAAQDHERAQKTLSHWHTHVQPRLQELRKQFVEQKQQQKKKKKGADPAKEEVKAKEKEFKKKHKSKKSLKHAQK